MDFSISISASPHQTKTPAIAVGVFADGVLSVAADAIDRAKSTDRAAIIDALNKSTFSNHIMPYGTTQFVNGQNMGAQPLMTQVVKGDIKVIVPRDYREVEPIFPLKA